MVREDGKHVGWVYCYTCVDESLECFGWDYVGQTRMDGGVSARDYAHKKTSVRRGTFDIEYQAHPDSFQLDVVDEIVCDTEEELVKRLNCLEQYYIRLFATYIDWGMGFNNTVNGGSSGRCRSVREKISKSGTERWKSKEARDEQSEKRKNWFKKQGSAEIHSRAMMRKCQLLDMETGFVYDFESRKDACAFIGIIPKNANHYKVRPYRGRWLYIPSKD